MYIYLKVHESKFVFLALCIDNIFLAINDIDLLEEIK